jgi:hypothetical protein
MFFVLIKILWYFCIDAPSEGIGDFLFLHWKSPQGTSALTQPHQRDKPSECLPQATEQACHVPCGLSPSAPVAALPLCWGWTPTSPAPQQSTRACCTPGEELPWKTEPAHKWAPAEHRRDHTQQNGLFWNDYCHSTTKRLVALLGRQEALTESRLGLSSRLSSGL